MKQFFAGQEFDTDQVVAELVPILGIKPLGERDKIMEVLRHANQWLVKQFGFAPLHFKEFEELYAAYADDSDTGGSKGQLPPYVLECYLALTKKPGQTTPAS